MSFRLMSREVDRYLLESFDLETLLTLMQVNKYYRYKVRLSLVRTRPWQQKMRIFIQLQRNTNSWLGCIPRDISQFVIQPYLDRFVGQTQTVKGYLNERRTERIYTYVLYLDLLTDPTSYFSLLPRDISRYVLEPMFQYYLARLKR